MSKFVTLLAAFAFAATTFAPVGAAEARDRRGGYYDGGRHHGHYRGRDRDDELAAGAIGLVLGLAIGSLASQPRQPQARCTNNYQRCAPPPQYRDDGYYQDQRYEDERYYEEELEGGGYVDDGRSAYERDYGAAPADRQCVRQERQWDRYANRYVVVDVPC